MKAIILVMNDVKLNNTAVEQYRSVAM